MKVITWFEGHPDICGLLCHFFVIFSAFWLQTCFNLLRQYYLNKKL